MGPRVFPGLKKPRVPSYSLHKARGLACCKVAGKRIYLGPYGSTESHKRYAEVIRQLLAGNVVTEAPSLDKPKRVPTLTISDLVGRYLQHARGCDCALLSDSGRA